MFLHLPFFNHHSFFTVLLCVFFLFDHQASKISIKSLYLFLYDFISFKKFILIIVFNLIILSIYYYGETEIFSRNSNFYSIFSPVENFFGSKILNLIGLKIRS